MRFSAKALAIVSAILWGAGILLVGLINLAAPSYGVNFLHGLSSVYLGFHASRAVLDVLVGTGYRIVDGAVAGYLFALLYNFVVLRVEKAYPQGSRGSFLTPFFLPSLQVPGTAVQNRGRTAFYASV